MWVLTQGQEDPLEKEMATPSNIRLGNPMDRGEPGRLQSTGLHRVGHNLVTKQQEKQQQTI